MRKTREQSTWYNILQRCTNPKSPSWKNYGGRGITICDRWRNSYANFFADMGPRPAGMSIERKDRDGHYEPNNCHWASAAEQSRNTRRNKRITFQGETLCLKDWAARLDVRYNTLVLRLLRGWSVERMMTTPFLKEGFRLSEIEHGTAREYRHGCRCEPCIKAQRAYYQWVDSRRKYKLSEEATQ